MLLATWRRCAACWNDTRLTNSEDNAAPAGRREPRQCLASAFSTRNPALFSVASSSPISAKIASWVAALCMCVRLAVLRRLLVQIAWGMKRNAARE